MKFRGQIKGAGVKRARHNSSLLDAHILYVNGKYRGDGEVGKLMHDFSCTDPDDMNYEILAHPPGDRGRTGAAEKEDVDGDGGKVECRK